jgi:mannose-6-phosphate isomerase-like protein (cupin superfamily)
MKPNDIPENFKVIKPWGSEYTIYKNLITSTKLLNIEYNQSTSLHCHPQKKTGFILISGKVDINLGFYNTKKLESVSRIMIRPGLFHSTKNLDKKTATILEIETPIDVDDLVRFKDEYGRENKPYEDKNSMIKLSNEDPVFEDPELNGMKSYIVDGVSIIINKTNNIETLKNSKKDSIFVILEGGLVSKNSKYVLSPGDIVGMDTIEKLTEVFKIKKSITYLNI